jgi:hypothetical protein
MLLEPQNRFTRRATRERGSVRFGFFVFFAFVAVIGWLYVFFISDAFQVKNVEVVGTKGIDPVYAKREVYEVMDARPRSFWEPARHSLLMDLDHLEPVITDRLGVERVALTKVSTNILRLSIEERVRRFILRTPTQYLWMDFRGRVLAELNSQEQKDVEARLMAKRLTTAQDVPILTYPELTRALEPNEGIPDPKTSRWLAMGLQLQKQGIGYRELQPPGTPSSTRLVVITAQGYEAWFDTSQDTLETQIEAFKAFQQQKPKDLQIKEYVDARIPQRIYVK